MNDRLKRTAPLAAVFGLVVYCCWPYLGELGGQPAAPAPSRVGPPRADARAPAAPPGVARDPFRSRAEPPEPQPRPEPVRPPVAPAAPAEDVRLLAREFALTATLIRGRQRLALINGKLYREGDRLEGAKAPAQAYQLARVGPDRVWLRRGDLVIEVHYAARDARAAATGRRAGGP